MVFVSIAFLIFALVLFFVYYLVPNKYQWIVLLVASIFFYLYAGFKYFIFLLITILVTYFLGLLLEKQNQKENVEIERFKNEQENLCNLNIGRNDSTISSTKRRFLSKKEIRHKYSNRKRLIVIIGVLIGVGTLAFLKYFNFIGDVFNNFIFKKNVIKTLDLIIPLGISFYTFSSIGYLIDISRGVFSAQKNIFKYIYLFHISLLFCRAQFAHTMKFSSNYSKATLSTVNKLYLGYEEYYLVSLRK